MSSFQSPSAIEMIRDFLYIDWERIRSFVAQAKAGIVDTQTDSFGDGGRREKSAEGSLSLGFATGTGGSADETLFSRSRSETKSLHHAVFNLFEEYLIENDRLVNISGWKQSSFVDGGLVRVTGTVRFLDTSKTIDLIRNIVPLQEVFENLDSGANTSAGGRAGSGRPGADRKKELKQYENMASVVETTMGNRVSLAIVPESQPADHVLVGNCNPDVEGSTFRHDLDLGGAVYYDQITALVYVSPDSSKRPVIKTGNLILDAFDEVFQKADFSDMLGKPTFPAVPCTPLAVYRELAPI